MARTVCPQCGGENPENFKFCGFCGSPIPARQPAVAIPAPPRGPPPSGPAPGFEAQANLTVREAAEAKLVVLRGAVSEGTAYTLTYGRTSVGRRGSIAFPSDATLDDEHLVLDFDGRVLTIVDVPGRGGCFRRIHGAVSVLSGDVIFAGEQFLLVRRAIDVPAEDSSAPDHPPEVFGTPLPPPRIHCTQLLTGGIPGRVASTDRNSMTVGREGCDLSFPNDRFMSGRHLRIEHIGDEISAVDVGSLNGTFARLQEIPCRLEAGDEIMIGTMLLRVDLPG